MQSLALPRLTSLATRPSVRPVESEDGLAKFRSTFSPTRPEQHSYPSPPMSEPHSPVRRIAQTSEAAHVSYSTHGSTQQKSKSGASLPPPSTSSFESQTTLRGHGNSHYPSSYLSEARDGCGRQHSDVLTPPNYGYEYPAVVSPYATSSQLGGPKAQQSTMISPPAARPSKPARRTKAHVASACVNCKKAHLSCDVQRPCGRCVTSGKQDSCKDVQHKKRGRPRLRDDREFTRSEEERQPHNHILGALPAPRAYMHQPQLIPSSSLQGSDQDRAVGGGILGPKLAHSTKAPTSDLGHASHVGDDRRSAASYAAGCKLSYSGMPVAFLDLDLVIQKSNQAFANLIAFLGDVRGKHLGDLLEARQSASTLQRLRNALRDERDEREPAYMAPITPVGKDPMHAAMDFMVDNDIDHVSHGFTARPMFLNFRLPIEGQYQPLQVQIRLAKTSLYFVTLVVYPPSRSVASSLPTQPLASPTSMHALQPTSVPSTAPGAHFNPQSARLASSNNSTPSSPYFNFSTIRTSLPSFSPSSYGGSPSYDCSPTTSPEAGYFPTLQPSAQPPAAPSPSSPYASDAWNASITSEPLRALNRPARLEGLHLPPIRTGPPSLGSPLHMDPDHSMLRRDGDRVRHRDVVLSMGGHHSKHHHSSEQDKRRRLDIHEVLG